MTELKKQSPNAGADLCHPPKPWVDLILWLLLGCAVLHAIFILIVGLTQPIVGVHDFRQTQTALTTYWLLQGGPWLNYETPVLGAPWSIPMEFPLYQWIVAALALSGVPLDISGRLVSFFFLIATLWPIRIVARILKLGDTAFLATVILFLAAPIHTFWGRAFLIETCALFFCTLWLALLLQFLVAPTALTFTFCATCGIAGALVKVTTFPAFALLGAAALAQDLLHLRSTHSTHAALVQGAKASGLFIAPVLAAAIWVLYSDNIKSNHPFGHGLTSTALREWNWGTVAQRLDSLLWLDTVANRSLPDALGWGAFAALAISGLTLAYPRWRSICLASLLAYIVPFALFANLHIIHDYYQCANSVFVIAAVALGISALAQRFGKDLATAAISMIMVLQFVYFYQSIYWKSIRGDFSIEAHEFGLAARRHVSEGTALVMLGQFWSTAIPYHAQRKVLALPHPEKSASGLEMPLSRISSEQLGDAISNPEKYLGGLRLGGIVTCHWPNRGFPIGQELIDKHLSTRAVLYESEHCRLLAP